MVPLSEFRRFQVVDARLRQAMLCELAVSSPEEDYPRVTSLLFRNASKEDIALPWAGVISLDFERRCIRVASLDEGVAPEEARANETLLMRDVLDARIIILDRLHTGRANELWLEETAGQLLVRAADSGWKALARRIFGGFPEPRRSDLYDWRSIEYLRGEPRTASDRALCKRRICHLSAKELGRLAEMLPYPHAGELLCLLPDQLAADAVEEMLPGRRVQVFEFLSEERGEPILRRITPDVTTAIMRGLNPQKTERYLNRLTGPEGQRVLELLRYPEDTAGGIMLNDLVCLPENITVNEARIRLRACLVEPDFIYFIYVCGKEPAHDLRGVLTLRGIMTAAGDKFVGDIMKSDMVTLSATDSAECAAYRVIETGLSALPVVGDKGRLLGAVTIDAAVAAVAPPRWASQMPRIFS